MTPTKAEREELRAPVTRKIAENEPDCVSDDEVTFGELLTLLDALDRAEAERQEQHDIVARIWVQLGSPTYEQLAGRSIYDMVDELKGRAETAEATIARLTAPVTEEEWRGFVMKAMWFREAGNVETPTWEALTAFLEGRKGSTLADEGDTGR